MDADEGAGRAPTRGAPRRTVPLSDRVGLAATALMLAATVVVAIVAPI